MDDTVAVVEQKRRFIEAVDYRRDANITIAEGGSNSHDDDLVLARNEPCVCSATLMLVARRSACAAADLPRARSPCSRRPIRTGERWCQPAVSVRSRCEPAPDRAWCPLPTPTILDRADTRHSAS